MENTVKVLGKEATPIKVLIKTRIKTMYEDTAATVTSVNEQGEFDVLPQHTNFITLIKDYVIIDKGRESEKKFDIDKGLLSAILDEVNVYIGL
ncbi:hypothetical protein JXA34_00250 [Patescibacteria group bacterium]|nr:hypothetical protein [Patescibacteria group bacterium]